MRDDGAGPPGAGVTGVVLEVEEFAVHDGPGIRTVVFLKGCPLRCTWCHNPEAITFGPQRLAGHEPRVVGVRTDVATLAARVLRFERLLVESGGGVTFSGGEPMAQARFLVAAAGVLRPLHVAVETSAHVAPAVFARVVAAVDLVMVDVKHTDPEIHRRHTGRDNALVLENVRQLVAGTTPFVVRVPLIPGVNDDPANLERTARLVAGAPALRGVELLPYNTMAPAKYARAGRVFRPGFDTTRPPRVDPTVFERYDIPCEVL